MKKLRIGILGTSEIAYRRFLPSLANYNEFEYVGVASRDIEKTEKFVDKFGGVGFGSYDELIMSSDIDCIYIPLPPSMHYMWARKALENSKHVMLEKPSTTNELHTKELVKLAKAKDLAIVENYMFEYHNQLQQIKNKIIQNEIGTVRQVRIAFGFPKRNENDFRYNKELGGGALLDCGGYTIRLSTILLGSTTRVLSSSLLVHNNYGVDIHGSATLINDDGLTAQVCFGMDNEYKCELEVWGSTGCIIAPRIFTTPNDMLPIVNITKQNQTTKLNLKTDDQFYNSIDNFYKSIIDKNIMTDNYNKLLIQIKLVQNIIGVAQ